MKKIPIGIEDFRELIQENYYYVDKTKFIEELVNDGAKVTLFTRPRRFGKTLNMLMLKYFFDIEEKDTNRELFKNLYIENSKAMEKQGRYPVIFLSMKRIQSSNIDSCIDSIKLLLENLFKDFRKILPNLDELDKPTFLKYATGNISEEEAKVGLKTLSNLLYDYYKEQVIVLIDEYDAPLTYAYSQGYYKEAVDFFKTFYGNVLKTNSNLKMGILTGAVRVAQAGIFSDLNNLRVNTILDETYDEYFGLTEKEVKKFLEEFEIEYTLDEVKSWYDGYRFGKTEVYNPWSILMYVDSKELKAHWVNTSGNVLIKELLLNSKEETFKDLKELVEGKEKTVFITENIALGTSIEPNKIWELLLFSGYLTIKEKIDREVYLVRIPNKEINTFFKSLFVEILFEGNSNLAKIREALRKKDSYTIVKVLEDVVINAMSFYDTNKRYENPYQTLISGFLYGLGEYKVISNIETGYGRADIILKPRIKGLSGYVFELKRAVTKNIEKEAEEAHKQIEEKRYDNLLREEGIEEIIKIGLVFDGKRAQGYF